MADIIQVLPDSVANQIAAGEVIQRPASVVKELMENAVDAEADEIKVVLKDAGKTFIQIIDNGWGMTDTDARLAFERHSTSKIKQAEDLFAINTMGFRGEALASIAAIAHIDLKTRAEHEEIGTFLRIEGSRVVEQDPTQCPKGSNFLVKNLFFNVPARRKFLKKDTTELNNAIREFVRVAMAYPQIAFTFIHNDHILYKLKKENFGQRIVGLFGKNIKENLIPVKTETRIVKIHGYIGHPEKAKKKSGEQFFFVNNRFMKNPYLYKAVMDAYEKLIPHGAVPSFFLRFELGPDNIDVNIHPTKTEIKFEDQQAIWQILNAAIRESLGKYNAVPSLDFDQKGNIGIPTPRKNQQVKPPEIEIDPTFNPFKNTKDGSGADAFHQPSNKERENLANWESLYEGFEHENEQQTMKFSSKATDDESEEMKPGQDENRFFQFKGKFILTPVRSGLMIIHQRRAHVRILYELYIKNSSERRGTIQKRLYPEDISLNFDDYNTIKEIKDDLQRAGFEIEMLGNNTVRLTGVPGDIEVPSGQELLENFLEEYYQNKEIAEHINEHIAISLARASSISQRRKMEYAEMRELVDKLFACSAPNYTPEGEKIISLMQTEAVEKLF
ncbi:MAG: DNA mismatch repair endonuclease MutL [Bacteroidota bacterium]